MSDTTDTYVADSEEEPTIACTDPDVAEERGLLLVTTEEMGFLRAMNWGDGYRQTCVACGAEMIFEKHPADWPNHPSEPGELRVAIECPACATKQFTDGLSEMDFQKAMTAQVDAEVRAEVARRLNAPVVDVRASDSGTGGDVAPGL